MRTESKKLQAEMTESKSLVRKMENSLLGLSSRVTDDKISEVQDELQKTFRQQHHMVWGGGPSK